MNRKGIHLSVVLIGQNAMTFLQLNFPSISAPSPLASHPASAVNGFSERIERILHPESPFRSIRSPDPMTASLTAQL
jgi:hypothetical protein